MNSKNKPYFIEQAEKRFPRRQSMNGDSRAGVLIVGGGITGLATAYSLSREYPADRIILIDNGRIGFSTTGNSAGLLVDSIEEDFCDMDPEVYTQVRQGLEGILKTAKDENIQCDLRELPSIYIARKEEQVPDMIKEYKARKEAGFPFDLFHRKKLADNLGINAEVGMWNKNGYCIDPVSFTQELARKLEQKGAHIYEDTRLDRFDSAVKRAFTQNGAIDYQTLVLTNSSPSLDNKMFRDRVMLLASSAGVTEPLNKRQIRKLWKNGEIIGWDADFPSYIYFRPVGKDRLLVGGCDKLVSQKDVRKGDYSLPEDEAELKRQIEDIFPEVRRIKFSNFWTGVMPVSVDGVPLAGKIQEDHYVGMYSGGLPFSFRAGEIISQLITRKNPEGYELFNPKRKMPLKDKIRTLTRYQPFTGIANRLIF